MIHPVSVIIPTIESRQVFLANFCLPSVWANYPAEVFVVGGSSMNANEKRNAGVRAATQPYLLFVDDDSVLMAEAIQRLMDAMYGDAAVAFGGYKYNTNEYSANFKTKLKLPPGEIFPGKWNYERLKRENYIDTTSLIRADRFPGFDPAIRRFQDWDLWLTMAARGCRGAYVPYCVVEKYVIDENISARIPEAEAREAIVRKHGLS